jgi:NADH-quinone oxidoreductase subunit M
MNFLHFPWLGASILLPLLGGAWIVRTRDPVVARRQSLVVGALTLACSIGAWLDFGSLHAFEAHEPSRMLNRIVGPDILVVDELSAPLLPLAALLYVLTFLATLRTKVRRFSFPGALISLAFLLTTLSCRAPWVLIMLLAAGTVPPGLELRSRRKSTRVFVVHMLLFVGLMVAGQALLDVAAPDTALELWGGALLTAAVLIRSGIVPLHGWMTDLFERVSFGTALLFVTPMVGAYGAVRLVLPVAPGWALHAIALISLFTAVYAAGMALVQREARRFFCYLFLSHSSLVLAGLETATPVGLTGALMLWISVGLGLAGFGLTLRAMEARADRLSLDKFHGLYEHTPSLAAFFLLTGLASVGFPGTFGFVGSELLIEGAVQIYPLVGMAVVLAAALNGIAVVQAYLRVFTGTRHIATFSLHARLPERIAVLGLAALIVGGGIWPQPGIASRYHAAMSLIKSRQSLREERPESAESVRGSNPKSLNAIPSPSPADAPAIGRLIAPR